MIMADFGPFLCLMVKNIDITKILQEKSNYCIKGALDNILKFSF